MPGNAYAQLVARKKQDLANRLGELQLVNETFDAQKKEQALADQATIDRIAAGPPLYPGVGPQQRGAGQGPLSREALVAALPERLRETVLEHYGKIDNLASVARDHKEKWLTADADYLGQLGNTMKSFGYSPVAVAAVLQDAKRQNADDPQRLARIQQFETTIQQDPSQIKAAADRLIFASPARQKVADAQEKGFTLSAGQRRFEPSEVEPPADSPAGSPGAPLTTRAPAEGIRLPDEPIITSSDPRAVPGASEMAFPPEPPPPVGDRLMPVGPWGDVKPGARPMPPASSTVSGLAAPATSRYREVASLPEKPTSEQDDQRYRQIVADQQMGKRIAPEALAWAVGYKNQKEIGPMATSGAAMDRQTATLAQQVEQQRRAQDFAERQAGRTELSNKVEQPYLDAREKTETLRSVIEAARGGNMEAGAVQSLMGVLGLVTTEGVKRINNVELQQVAGAGSLFERIKSQAGKLTSGAPLSPKLQSDLEEMSRLLERGARTKYEAGFRAITKRYGLTDEEMVPGAPAPAAPPSPFDKSGNLRGQ